MRKIVLFVLLLAGGCIALQAQLLWKISGNGLKKTSWLFASYHYVPIQFFDSIPGIYRAFDESEQMVCEVALNRIDSKSRLENAASMPNHTRMSDLLKEERYTAVDTALRSVMKLGLKELNMMNPTLILSLYSMELFKKQTKQTDDNQSDSYFQLVADEKNKKVVGLESVEQSLKVLYGNISLQRQADILFEKVSHKDLYVEELLKMDKLYKAGKIEELSLLSRGSGQSWDPTSTETALNFEQRQEQWLAKLPELMKNNSCFITIGAEHLGGKTGLIKMLEKAGYHLSPVR